jgi:hypothetical protein
MKKISYIYTLLIASVATTVLSGCYERKKFPEPNVELSTLGAMITDLRATPNTRTADPLFAHYTTFKAAIEKTGLDAILRDNSKKFVVFAPDDLAFEQLPLQFRNAQNILAIRTRDANGDIIDSQYNDSLFLRTLMLNHIVELANNEEMNLSTQTSYSSLVTQPTNFRPAADPRNVPWIDNRIVIAPSQGVQGSLTFTPPSVNGVPMFSWGTKASNGTINQIGAILYPANVYEFLRKDGRHNSFLTTAEFYPDVVAYLSSASSSMTVFPTRATFALPNDATTKTRIQHHILAPSVGRVANLAPTGAVRYLPNLNAGRNTGIALASGTTCIGAATVAAVLNDPTSPTVGIAAVGFLGLTSYSFTCIPPSGLLGYIATSNGIVYSTSALLNP